MDGIKGWNEGMPGAAATRLMLMTCVRPISVASLRFDHGYSWEAATRLGEGLVWGSTDASSERPN